MRYLTFFNVVTNDRIDIYNSMFGKETVYHNGNKVSEVKSFWGGRHNFTVIEAGDEAAYQIKIAYRLNLGIGFDVFRNGKALLLS